jgi:transcriptional regulator with XRE-family HTH domain
LYFIPPASAGKTNTMINNQHQLTPLPLRALIRQRREQLNISQAQVAEAFRLTPEAVGHWERGTRRVELGKLPRLAVILQLDGPSFCYLALCEYFPVLAACLFAGQSDHTDKVS